MAAEMNEDNKQSQKEWLAHETRLKEWKLVVKPECCGVEFRGGVETVAR
jgi:hypothetical protein